MEKKEELRQLKAELVSCRKEIKSLKDKLSRSQSKLARQKTALKKKEITTIEVSAEQQQLFSNRLPDIDIKSLLFD